MNYYIVIKGKDGLNIYDNWGECESKIKGFSGAVYKKVKREDEILPYMKNNGISNEEIIKSHKNFKVNIDISSISNNSKKLDSKPSVNIPKIKGNNEKVIAYVDGSYNSKTEVFGFGLVFIREEGIQNLYDKDTSPEYIIFEKYEGKYDKNVSTMNNVAGELRGAMFAIHNAIDLGYKEIDIYYDYEGIEKWVTGTWRTKNEYTKKYKEYMLNKQSLIKMNFHWVKGHSKNKWNEYVDILAKKGAGIL